MRQLLQNPLQWSVRKALPPNQLPLEQRRNPNSSGRPVSSPFSPRLVCPPTMRHQLRLTLPLWSRRRPASGRSEEHTSELQSRGHLVCRLLLEKKKKTQQEENQ